MDFYKSFANFWGALTTATASFSILNNVFLVLPLIQNYEKIQTTGAFIFSVFALMLSHSTKDILPSKKIAISIIYAIFSLIFLSIYLYLESEIREVDSFRLSITVVIYILFFFFLTSAFSTLAIRDYTNSAHPQTGE